VKVYLAGNGHKIHSNPDFINRFANLRILLSFYYLEIFKDKDLIDRFKWIIHNKGGKNEKF